ncbi:hypothetical protein pipiens_014633 [Culex pipiens pipiens]|uniref:Uncharacterized protein n=1 Tax=Culex pipiens pipiens TaxID=38569 RepID=A0ABD1CTR5_CULPP
MPVKVTNSKKLISHDIHSNSYNKKYSYALDVVPISKGSLVFLGKKLHKTLGYISPITKEANAIHLIDPSGRVPSRRFATPSKWWFVMDVEIVRDNVKKKFPHAILELLLVKKYYDKSLRKQSRNWNANLTEVGALDTDIEADYNEQQSMPVDVNDMADPSVPRINLEELLDDMVLDDVEMSDA